MTISIYQIQLTDDQIDQVNKHGHDSVPAQKARLDVMFGSEGFKPENFRFYTKTMSIDVLDLDTAFEYTQFGVPGIGNNSTVQHFVEQFVPSVSSTSVGDIFYNDETEEFYMVDAFGFAKVEPEYGLELEAA